MKLHFIKFSENIACFEFTNIEISCVKQHVPVSTCKYFQGYHKCLCYSSTLIPCHILVGYSTAFVAEARLFRCHPREIFLEECESVSQTVIPSVPFRLSVTPALDINPILTSEI
jgi:hypothetical protein